MVNILGLSIKRANMTPVSNGVPVSQTEDNNSTGWLGGPNGQMRTIRSDVANDFAQVNAIVQEAVNRDIYAMDAHGNRYDDASAPPMWQLLQAPNEDMSFTKFLRSALTSYIANRECNILFWHNGDDKPFPGYTTLAQTIGLTFLPRGCRANTANQVRYAIKDRDNGVHYVGRESVASLSYLFDPDTNQGISPGSASHQLARILDYLNMHLTAYFTNGATPKMNVVIHAKTPKEFHAIRHSFERANRGPVNAYGTTYQYVADDGIQGSGAPRIEMNPVGGNALDLDIKNLTDYAQNVINANLGVSPLIYGDTDSTSYQNQEVVNDKFNRRVVNTLRQFLGDLTLELNRITGGIGFVFGFDYEETEYAEKELVQAQTRAQDATVWQQMINLGVDSDAAARAIGRDEWIGLGAVKQDQPNALMLQMAPQPAVINATSPQAQISQPVVPQLPKGKTGATTRVRDRQPVKHDRIRAILTDMAKQHLARWKTTANAAPDEDQKYVNELLAELQKIADNGGVTVARQLAQQIKGQTVSTGYEVAGTALQQLTDRASKVISNYSEYLDKQINKAAEPSTDLETGETSTPSQSDVSDTIDSMITGGAIGSMIDSITNNEGKYAFQSGQQDNAVQIQDAYHAVVTKTWKTTSGHPCEFCEAMEGTEAGAEDAFVKDGIITAANGDTLALDPDYSDGTMPDGHDNCLCVYVWGIDGDDGE